MRHSDAELEALKASFRPVAETQVLLIKRFKKGDPFPNPTMEQLVYPSVPATFSADLCLVKLLIGPGNPGPTNAPSTSSGIGIEVWLPEKDAWNQRIHAVGGSGWANGTEEAVLDKISSWTGGLDTRSAPRIAAEEGAVTSTTDSGYPATRSGSFLMNPDGKLNTNGLRDWSYRALYLQAIVTKALATAYYGRPPKYAYFDGASGGGRQAFHVAQNLPEQYDGIVAGVAALNWIEIIANLYPAIVIQQDLDGKPLSRDQLTLASNAAIASCERSANHPRGFILDNASCRYDPSKDPAILTKADGGSNDQSEGLSKRQALALNKFWYGMTRDGSAPDPSIDNGWDHWPEGNRLWYGLPRGSDLSPYADPKLVISIAADIVALVMGDSRLGPPEFKNALGDGENGWMKYGYTELAEAFERAKTLPSTKALVANNPDLSTFKARGGKLLNVTHVDDNLLWSQGAIDYYERVAQAMGGIETVQSFFKLYLLPGLGHGHWNGTMNPAANPPVPSEGQFYQLLVDWVEKGVAPKSVEISSSALENKESGLAPFRRPRTPETRLSISAYPAPIS